VHTIWQWDKQLRQQQLLLAQQLVLHSSPQNMCVQFLLDTQQYLIGISWLYVNFQLR
jgi:hypothetical protein